MAKRIRYSDETKERAVRTVFEHQEEYGTQWSGLSSIAPKIGCTSETPRRWVRQAGRDQGLRAGFTTSERERLRQVERENRRLRQANEMLRKATAFSPGFKFDRKPRLWCL